MQPSAVTYLTSWEQGSVSSVFANSHARVTNVWAEEDEVAREYNQQRHERHEAARELIRSASQAQPSDA